MELLGDDSTSRLAGLASCRLVLDVDLEGARTGKGIGGVMELWLGDYSTSSTLLVAGRQPRTVRMVLTAVRGMLRMPKLARKLSK